MYRTCLACTSDLGANQVIETLPIGRRIAFDSRQGRLWVVCPHCAKWNLVPFDSRLEAVDDCERHFRATATRYSTEHIGLARMAEGLDLIRIGPALGEEFASWRYGRAFQSRRRRHRLMAGAVGVPLGLVLGGLFVPSVVTASSALIVASGVGTTYSMFRMGLDLGTRAMARRRLRLRTRDPWGTAVTLNHEAVLGASMHLVNDELQLHVEQSTAIDADDLVFRGAEADGLVRRILGRLNAVDGSPDQVTHAVSRVVQLSRSARSASLLDLIGGERGILDRTDRGETGLAAIGPQERLAFEMWANEESERQFLAGELKLLERQWREADALASIADGLALPGHDEDAGFRL